MHRRSSLIAVVALALAASSCSERPSAGPEAFESIRQYGWDVPVGEPEAAWSPVSDRVVSRAQGGFLVLSEDTGSHAQQKFTSNENRETRFPAWINEDQVVFGPGKNAEKLSDGRVISSPEGLTVVTLGKNPLQKQLAKFGYRPRVGQKHVFAQVGDKIVGIDELGDAREFGIGFFAEPEAAGPGMAWQETPVYEEDFWTGKPVRSNLVIRWRPGQIDQIPGAVQPRWTSDGALTATVLRGDPQLQHAWWDAGTDVVLIPGRGKAPVIIAHDARDPAPHPIQPVVAVTTSDGKIALVSRDGAHRVEIAEGRHPAWNHDGTRLMIEENAGPTPLPTTIAKPKSGARLTVLVFAIHESPKPK